MPTVVCDQPTGVEGVDRVGVDDRAAMLALARHLTGLGHRRIGVLCMRLGARPQRRPRPTERQAGATYPVQRDRLAGLRDGLAEAGVDWSGRAGRRAVRAQRRRRASRAPPSSSPPHPELTAVVCTSDILALGALRHAADARAARCPTT